MMKLSRRYIFGGVGLMLGMSASVWAGEFDTPRLGIVISKSSVEQHWGVAQMSAHGWAAVANLAGIPYDCLFLEELGNAGALARYDLLIFGQCAYVDETAYQRLIGIMPGYLAAGGNILVDGPLATSDEQTKDRQHDGLDAILGLDYPGFKGNSEYRLKIVNNAHYITRSYAANEFATQHLVNGLNILQFKNGGKVLLASSNERQSFPFLSCRASAKNRLILVSDFSTWAGAASFFRNVQPQVFYANQLFNIMIRAVQWAVYGDIESPFPAPQVSNANITAIVRLDADGSNNLEAQIKTINYLVDLARQSGVVPVYAWVSSAATKAGWQDLAPLGKKIEDVGGEIGTHSKYHRINKEMTAERWEEELGGSIHEIEFNLADYDYPMGEVEWFINPGNTIQMKDYEEIAKRFSFYMTHGFEQDMPLGYGNLTWYTGPHRNLVVLENIPSPDYQWFNDPTWSYTTAQIAAYEEAIFDHLYERIGRGVIFNEMWHDYSITTQPQSKKDRIINESNIAFYDAMKAKFASRKIYCPTPEELGHKLRAMAQWNYRWRVERQQMEVELDLSNVRLDTIPHFTGGMGLRIENTKDCIQKVTINGKPHFAFTDQLIILPNLKKGVNKISLTLGAHSSSEPRLTYVSSRMPAIEKKGDALEVEVLTKSKARFSFHTSEGAVVLNADWQEWNRAGDGMLDGFVTSDRQLTLRPIERQELRITRAEVRIAGIEEKASTVTLKLHPAPSSPGAISFRCAKKPARVVLANQALEISQSGRDFRVAVPEHATTTDLTIEF